MAMQNNWVNLNGVSPIAKMVQTMVPKKNIFTLPIASLLVLVALTLLYSIPLSSAAEYGFTDITVKLISQEPDPVEPGEILTLKFKVENNRSPTREAVKVELLPQYPFSAYSGKSIVDIGKLRSGQTGADAVIVEFKVKVDAAATEQQEKIDLRILNEGIWENFEDFPITIRTRSAILSLNSIKTEPFPIPPGKDVEVALELANNAGALLRNIKVRMNLSSSIPFAPSSSGLEKQFYQLSPNSSRKILFNLIALPDAKGGIYKVPLTISFTDETGKSYVSEETISLSVSSKSDLLVGVSSYSKQDDTNAYTLSIKIVNRGLTDVKLMTASLIETNNLLLLSDKEVYVGNIESDDYETVDFKIKPITIKNITVPIELTYRDATNKIIKDKIIIPFKPPQQNTSWLSIIFAVFLLCGAGVGIFFWYKKKKETTGMK